MVQRIWQRFCCCSKNVRCVVSLTLETRIGYNCNTHCYQREICDGLEIKLTWPLSWIQQAGAPNAAAKSLTPIVLLAVIDYKRSGTSLSSTKICSRIGSLRQFRWFALKYFFGSYFKYFINLKTSELGQHCPRCPYGNAPGGNQIMIVCYRPAPEFVIERRLCAHQFGNSNQPT